MNLPAVARAALVASLAAVAACGSTEPVPNASLAGEWALASVNGNKLPLESGDDALVAGVIRFHSNGSWGSRYTYRTGTPVADTGAHFTRRDTTVLVRLDSESSYTNRGFVIKGNSALLFGFSEMNVYHKVP